MTIINSLRYTRFHIKIIKAKILSHKKLWGIDSWFYDCRVESWAAIDPNHFNRGEFSWPHQKYNSSWAWYVGLIRTKTNIILLRDLVLITCEYVLSKNHTMILQWTLVNFERNWSYLFVLGIGWVDLLS